MMTDDDPRENVVEFRRRDPQDAKPKSRTRGESGPAKPTEIKYDWLKPGVHLDCKVITPERGGYLVATIRDDLPAYLVSNTNYEIGDVVCATYVCLERNRMLLSECFKHGKRFLDEGEDAKGFAGLRIVERDEEDED